jgi:hypothetical protein
VNIISKLNQASSSNTPAVFFCSRADNDKFMKAILYFTALLFSISLFGCKPQETALSGQVFVVTRGAENIKLGLVEVQLIERKQITEYLQKNLPPITSQWKHECETKIDAINEQLDKKTITDPEESQKHTAFSDLLWRPYSGPVNQIIQQETNLMILKAELYGNRYFIEHMEAGKDNYTYESAMRLEESVNLLPARIAAIEQSLSDEKAGLNNLKNGDFSSCAMKYLVGFSPVVSKKVLTDADGKFFISYPLNKAFTIFAKAERVVSDTKETYFWVVNAPTGVETAQIFLSNNNLVTIDPDGYFKIKPKSELQESTPQ